MTVQQLANMFSMLDYRNERFLFNGIDVTDAVPSIKIATNNGEGINVGNTFGFEWPNDKRHNSRYEVISVVEGVSLNISTKENE